MKSAPNKDYVRDIITDYDKLSERCLEHNPEKDGKNTQQIILELKNTIREHDIAALSANQIGHNKRIICMNFNGTIKTFINPVLTNMKGLSVSIEYCSSIPDTRYLRVRNNVIEVTYLTPMSKIETVELVGMAAKLMQHHLEHLDGILLSDIGLEIDEDFDKATPEEREAVINLYLESLDASAEYVEQLIDQDPEASRIREAEKFIASVDAGETILEPLSSMEKEE